MFWYVILTIIILANIAMIFQYVNAQTIFCDKELFIYFLHNDLDGMIGCINAPDAQQDSRIMELEEKIMVLENQTKTINGNITIDR